MRSANRATSVGVRGLMIAIAAVALGPGADHPRDVSALRGRSEPMRGRALEDADRNTSAVDDTAQPIALRSSEGPARAGGRAQVVPQRLVVRFRSDVSEAAKERARSLANARLVRQLPLAGAEVIALPAGTSIADARQRLASDPNVAYAEPDFIYEASAVVPNDPRFGAQWGLHVTADTDIDGPEAWSSTRGSAAILVGIADTGVAYDHPDLSPNIFANPAETAGNGVDDDGNGYVDDVRGWDWVDRDSDPLDLNGHGTHVAGTVGAKGNNGTAVTGVSWNATLVPLRVLGANGSGATSNIATAFSYAGELGIDVVNASLGGGGFSQTLLDAIRSSPDTLFVVSAGNDARNNDTTAYYPCNYDVDNIVCVAATTQTDGLASFSSYGASTVDLGAPGSGILSTIPKSETVSRDDFGAGFAEKWSTSGTGHRWGISDDTKRYLADSPADPYLPNSNATVSSINRVDLRGVRGCKLRYALRLDTEKTDDLLISEVSENGTDWAGVGSTSGRTEGPWNAMSLDLSKFDGRMVHLRFRLTSDADSTVGAGADIDDLEVRCIGTSYTGSEVASYSGTSMAAPHVAGAAAVLKTATPDLDGVALKSAVMAGTVQSAALVGKTVTGGRLNLARSLSLLAPLPVDPVPSPSPIASSSPTPARSPSPTPSTSPSPSPSASAEPSPSPEDDVIDRSIRLRLRRHLVAQGVVGSSEDRCSDGVTIVIKRNGRRIAVTSTGDAGGFRIRVRDRTGWYAAVATEEVDCPLVMARVRHRH